jgi:hypothetical protein
MTASSVAALTPRVAPNFLAKANFSSLRSTAMIGSAPTLAQACTMQSPTPPTPKTATESPFCTFAVLIAAPHPVITAQPMIAVTSVATLSAIFTTSCWSAIVASAQVKARR